MNDKTSHQRPDVSLDPRIQLAYERFGFAIAKFFAYIRAERGETATLLTPRALGLIMIVMGLMGLILANWQQRWAVKALRKRCPELPPPVAGVVSGMIAFLGILALVGALLR